MIDAHAVILNYLESQADLLALTGSRIYAGRNVPPVGYKPSDGNCVTFKVRGGGPDYEDALLNTSVQVKVYASSEVDAWALYNTLYDAVHNGRSASVLHAECEVLGQLLEEPDTQWIFVLGFFEFMLRQ